MAITMAPFCPMKKRRKQQIPGVPSSGAIVHYLVHALDLPIKEMATVTYSDLHRISSDAGSEAWRFRIVCAIVDHLVSPDAERAKAKPTQTALEMRKEGSPFRHRYRGYQDGSIVFDPPELARLILDFLALNEELRAKLGPDFRGPHARFVWLHAFVIPFLASKAAELKGIGVDWEGGMPGGCHWYIQLKFGLTEKKEIVVIDWPVQFVLRWWEDLLGCSLKQILPELRKGDPENAPRQLRKWLNDGERISFATVAGWAENHRSWDYLGAFQDDPSKPLAERWANCRLFLERKGLLKGKDWRDTLLNDAHGESLRQIYRGEPLEEEIPPFTNAGIPFSAFFESADPISHGLPVEELIRRVAYRWRKPTNLELRTRLLIARAGQKALQDLVKTTDVSQAIRASMWFSDIFDVIRNITASNALQLRDAPVTALDLLRRCPPRENLFEEEILENIYRPIEFTIALMKELFDAAPTKIERSSSKSR